MQLRTILVSTLGLAVTLAFSGCQSTYGKRSTNTNAIANASAGKNGGTKAGNGSATGRGGSNVKGADGKVVNRDGMSWRSHALPTGDKQTSAVLLSKGFPSEVQRNAPFDYVIEVSNLTNHKLEDVVVTDRIPAALKIRSSHPAMASTEGGVARWTFSELAAGGKQTIVVTGSTSEIGKLRSCANVSYDTLVCSSISVVEAAIKLTKTAPSEITVCQQIPVKYVVTNTGTGTARDIIITETLPANLTTVDKKPLSFRVESLGARQSKEFTVKLKASKPGTYSGAATAKGAGSLTAKSSSTSTIVRQPKLTITSEAPKQGFLGRGVTQNITVTNVGDYEARDSKLEQNIPAGAKLTSATGGGRKSGNKVVWNLGTIKVRGNRNVSATFLPTTAGILTSTATAEAHCADPVKSTATTNLVGIPAILMEVIDVEDPIPVGDEETYEIRVTNQGTAPGTDIKIVCTIEDSMVHVSSGGATRGTAVGNTITFVALRSLAPKAKATWRVKVRSVTEADARFKVIMTSAQSKRPVEETESTRFYK